MIKTSKAFMDQHFLLETEYAQVLYEQFAAPMPILDYHNHLSPADISSNRRFDNLTQIWLEGDHYKWRAMRINGVPEQFITGDTAPEDKFTHWAATVPYTMRNPLYHWTHLELKNYFGVNALLNETTAREIYEQCSSMLRQDEFCTRELLRKMNVEVVCTTDDPTDTLEHHRAFAMSGESLKMYPTFRPDKAFAADNGRSYTAYLEKLGVVAGVSIRTFTDLLDALQKRVDYFEALGCRAADHGLEHMYYHKDAEANAPRLFTKAVEGKPLSTEDLWQFKAAVLIHLGRMYHAKGWVQQFHLGALRNNNTRLLATLGPDTGFDSMADYPQAEMMSGFLDHLDRTDQLPKTILYNNNPSDNEVFATMTGNFSDGTVPGKIQFGSGWWFLDQKDGMERQMNALSNMGLISRFVGMVTDSRSFLSFPRHEYFRRVLCNLWGNDIRRGELPDDLNAVGKLIEGICYYNTKQYFRF
jgi:glucuronate isomerase